MITAEPASAPLPEAAELVIHLSVFGHTGSSGPGTTILADGRIIWYDNFDMVVEARLRPRALKEVQDELDASGVLDRSATYDARLRPGAEPPGHGVNGYRFELVHDGRPIVIDAQDPRSFAGEEAFWVIPPEMITLARIADHLQDPVTWLGSDGFIDATHAFRPDRYLVAIHLYRTGSFGTEPDVDAVRWPFGEPIESVGAPYDSGAEAESRCLLIDAMMASSMAAAEEAAGIPRDLGGWASEIEYEWPRGGGFVLIDLTAVLPYETGSCVELATTPR